MTHSPVPMTSVRYFATLRILFYALLAGKLIFLVITFVLRSTRHGWTLSKPKSSRLASPTAGQRWLETQAK